MSRVAVFLIALLVSAVPAHAQIERAVPQSQAEMRLSYAPVVETVAPAVVNVFATKVTGQRMSFGDPFFDRFFGESPFFRQRQQASQSLGSGVIVTEDGLILTNNHVVEGATDIRVVTVEGREYPVDLVLADAATDLAVLQIRDADRTFPVVEFADSDTLAVGDLVLAIGNPFGVGQSVSSGIVSALARTGMGITDYQFFIQTDAAINPGNSGGALVDMTGRLVGINTAIFTRSGGSQGIGFAIPSNMAAVIKGAAERGGEIVRPWLGVQLQALDNELADSLRIEVPRGALVTEVAPEGPADQAGLASGDVVTAINGFPVQDPESLDYRVATQPIGTETEFTVYRDGREIRVPVIMKAPSEGEGRQVTIAGNTRFAGTTATELSPYRAQSMGLSFSAKGVVVVDVVPGSPAHRLGLRPDDIVLALNGIEIHDIETFESLAGQRPQSWHIILQRDGQVIRSFVSG